MASSETVIPSDLYPFVYSYLKDNGLERTAKAFIKESNLVSGRTTSFTHML